VGGGSYKRGTTTFNVVVVDKIYKKKIHIFNQQILYECGELTNLCLLFLTFTVITRQYFQYKIKE
jgi:hypothetical protein